MTRWEWDPAKAEANLRKHGVSFELAVRAIDDPFSMPEADEHPDGDRWRTTGKPDAGSPSVLVVVHTDPVPLNDEVVGRIISARPATRQERIAMRKGNPDPLPPHLKAELARLEARLDEPVDLSDIPEATGPFRGVRGRFANARQQAVSVRLETALLEAVAARGGRPGAVAEQLVAEVGVQPEAGGGVGKPAIRSPQDFAGGSSLGVRVVR